MKTLTPYFKYLSLLFASICLLVVSFGSVNSFEKTIVSQSLLNETPKMNGLCWVAGDSIAQHNITQMTDVGADWISQTPFGWMDGITSPIVVLNKGRSGWGESDSGLAYTSELAKAQGVKTMLKPHLWINNANGKWRSDIKMKNSEDWDKWFASYGKWIMHYARLAEEHSMESLCIGTEFYIATKTHPDKWRSLIRNIRNVYGGKLIYAANWYKEFEEITFWGDLDYIGIQGYFPLANGDSPEKEELLKSWKKHKKSLERIAIKYNKKIIFTEIGYKNTADSAKEPWIWPQNMDASVIQCDATQRICYEALFESLWHEPWMGGIFIWKWFHTGHKFHDYDTYFATWTERRKKWAKRRGRELGPQVYFTPQRTEAIEILSKWYGGER